MRIESHHRFHQGHPLLQAIEYWITPQLFEQGLGTSCQHPVQIAIGKPEELGELRLVSHSISLGFCYLALRQSQHLSSAQAQRIIGLIHRSGLLQSLPLGENLITPSEEMLPGWDIPLPKDAPDVALPSHLTLLYHLPVELHTMAEELKTALAQLGCDLTVIFYDAKSWTGCPDLPQADLFMGDRLIGEMPEYALEQWLRCDALWPALFTESQSRRVHLALDEAQSLSDDTQRIAALKAIFTRLMSEAMLTPLFNYQYQVSAPPGVNGIRLNARGWFDFSAAWLPPTTR